MKLLITLFYSSSCNFRLRRSKCILLSTLFSSTLILSSAFNVRGNQL